MNAVLIVSGNAAGRTRSFFKGVHCLAKKLLNMFAFVFIYVANLPFIDIGGIKNIFFVITERFKNRPVEFSLNGWVI